MRDKGDSWMASGDSWGHRTGGGGGRDSALQGGNSIDENSGSEARSSPEITSQKWRKQLLVDYRKTTQISHG